MAVMTIKEILGDEFDTLVSQGKTPDEIRSYAKVKRKEQLAKDQTTPQHISKPQENNWKNDFNNYVENSDSLGADYIRAGATTAIRALSGLDYLSEKVGFNLIEDSTTERLNEKYELLEKKKEETSRANVTPERLKEIKELEKNSANANGVMQNVKAGATQMYDVITHPTEWTAQGTIENFIDPLNLVSLGAGGIASKFARTLMGKMTLGGAVGMAEGAVVNSAGEYGIAKGMNKSDEEAEKIAFQSLGAGALAGGTFGTVGGAANGFKVPITKKETDHSAILENGLLKEDQTPLSDDEITQKLQEAFNNYPKVQEEFKIEEAGVGIQPQHPDTQNFKLVYNNLPVVRSTMEKLPVLFRELVETEIIESEAVKQIQMRANSLLTHKDIIYADLEGWSENISLDIIDAINAKKINDFTKVTNSSSNAVKESMALSYELAMQGVPAKQIKEHINLQVKPTKEELKIGTQLNDGAPLENRFTGTRLRDMLINTIAQAQKDPQQLHQDLKSAGINDNLSNAIVQSYINKDIESFDSYVSEKLSLNVKEQSEQTKKALMQRLTQATQEDQQKDNYIKGINNVRTTNQGTNQQGIQPGAQDGDHGGITQSPADTKAEPKPGGHQTSEVPGTSLLNSPRTDAIADSSTAGVPATNQPMEGQQTPGLISGDVARTELHEMVPTQDRGAHVELDNYDLRDKPSVELSKGQRKQINEQTKAILDKPIEELTLEDKDILRQYTGQGGLSSEGYGMLSEHFTPYPLIEGIYNALEQTNFKPKKALEPSVGSGNFVGFKPELDWTTIDIDPTSHEVVKRLYPNAKHYLNSFEEYKGADFDLIISNVPFIETRGEKALDSRSDIKALHDYFFVESLDKVKPNGVIAFITSKGVMDKVNSKIRAEIVSKADVIGAYRLPSTTFSKNAHTDVIADIIFLQKRPDGVATRMPKRNEAFVKVVKTKDDININSYYKLYPSKILGEMKPGVNKQYGTKAYEITGTPKYESMKVDYKAYKTDDVSNKSEVPLASIPKINEEFTTWALQNDIEYYNADSQPSNFIKSDDGYIIFDKSVTMEDIDLTYKLYKKIEGENADKISLLDEINRTKNPELVKQYQEQFKTHPLKDRALTRLFRTTDSMDVLYEFGALFDSSFRLSEAFDTQTKFTNSGKLEVDINSSLHDRLLYNENSKAEISLPHAAFFDRGELKEAFELGYALKDSDTLVNEAIYYAGNVYTKIDQLQSIKESLPQSLQEQLDKQLSRLEEITPPKKPVDEIYFKGIEPWIINNDIKLFEFKKEEKWVKLPNDAGQRKEIKIVSDLGKLYDRFLNEEKLLIQEKGESETRYKRRLREAQTEIKQIQQQLKEKIKSDENLRAQFEEAYNRNFNFYVKPDYERAQYLIQDVLNELPKEVELRPNQIKWVIKALIEGKNINAHDVGGGKTMAGIVLARVLKKKGVAKKPLFVVPSKVINNWSKEITMLFPDAKIFNLGSLPKNLREKRLFELGNTQADYVLISHEGFKELKLPQEVESDYARGLLNENLNDADLKGRAQEILRQKVNKYLAILKRSNANKKITIDKLGIDAIIADEARAFKNVGVSSKLVQNRLGKAFSLSLNEKSGKITLDSALAYDFRFKTKYVSAMNNNSNIFMLDATPTPNKPIELFTMLKHLDDTIFDEYNIRTDRDFAEQFFDFGQKASKKGGFEAGLIGIKNAFALRSIMDRFIDRIPMRDFARLKLIDLPETETVKEMIGASDESIEVFDSIAERLKEAKSDQEKRKQVMGIFSNGVVSSADPRLYNHENIGFDTLIDPTPDNSKIEKVVESLDNTYKKNKKAGQIVFLDSGGHSAVNLTDNLHQEIKAKLMQQGFKKSQIAIISGQEITDPATGIEKRISGEKGAKLKQQIVEAYNQGKIKVVIGTTKSAGEGMNIQKFTTNIHHIDLPWTFGEVQQRNGRGERHGNINKKLRLHYYFQEGTFDSLMYSTVMKKRGWNEALWDSEAKDYIEVSDESGAMPSEAEILIEMERDPIIKRTMMVQLEHEGLLKEYDNIQDEAIYLDNRLSYMQEQMKEHESTIQEIIQERDNEAPTKTLRDMLSSVQKKKGKKKTEAKKEYDQALERYRVRREEFKTSREHKIDQTKEYILQLEEEKSLNDKDKVAINERLKAFEEKNYDEDGRIRTVLDEEEC